MPTGKGENTIEQYIPLIVELTKFSLFHRDHDHVSVFVFESRLFLFFRKSVSAFPRLVDCEYSPSILFEVHVLCTSFNVLVFLIYIKENTVEL